MKRVLALYSGGLDSTLAIALMRRAGVEVVPITFVTPFTNPLSKTGQLDKGTIIAKTFQLELQKIPLLEELITLIKNPKFGHGKNINPCIDCHLLMLQMQPGNRCVERAALPEWIIVGEDDVDGVNNVGVGQQYAVNVGSRHWYGEPCRRKAPFDIVDVANQDFLTHITAQNTLILCNHLFLLAECSPPEYFDGPRLWKV